MSCGGRAAGPSLLLASALLAVLQTSGCGGPRPTPPPPQDEALRQAARSGRQSLSFGRADQAVAQYRRAFALALARDDARAIGDVGYDLAVAQLAGDAGGGLGAAAALRTVLRTRDALAARASPGFAELDLAQAAALHRLGRDGKADPLAARAQATASDPATVARASFVRGLIADARGDAPGILAALATLDGLGRPARPSPDWQAAHDELVARLDRSRGRFRDAASAAQRAAALHRAQLEYRDMAALLAFAADAQARAGAPAEAARLYLQAGESAAARGDAASATAWLRQVLLIPQADPPVRQAARARLGALLGTGLRPPHASP